MQDQQISIGKRLQEVRSNYIAARKLSAIEFADILGESKYNISNYERGIASIPNRVLIELYKNGINPTWVLTGEQSIYINNASQAEEKNNDIHSNTKLHYFNEEDYAIIARAGNLMKLMAENIKPKEQPNNDIS